MTEHTTNVNLNQSGAENHAWTVLGTLLACGAIGMLAWAISAAGALDLAATGLSFFFVQLFSMMFKAGLLVVPHKNSSDFVESRGIFKTLWREFQEFQGRSPIWRLALLAFGFTVAYMIFRLGLSFALGVFGNIWIAGAAAALLASFIVSPRLFSSMIAKMKTRSGVRIKTRTDEPVSESTDS